MKYHINPETGNAGPCTAKVSCPFGTPEEHYNSEEEARSAYEEIQPALFGVDMKISEKAKPAK